jgi:hypothetical protein
MRFLQKTKDGGPESPVDAFFLFEIKSLFSVAVLRFNKGSRENFHSHAFNALTWFISGQLEEEVYNGNSSSYRRRLFPKITKRSCVHKVIAHETSWCFTIRGPWMDTWYEVNKDGKLIMLTHGRKIVK